MMATLFPPLIALVQTSCGAYLFQSCRGGQEQLVSSLIFLLSIFIMLWKVKVFPDTFETYPNVISKILRYLISQFIMEFLMNGFWFPLEKSVFDYSPKIADFESYIFRRVGIPWFGILGFTKARMFAVLISYILSFAFMICVFRAGAAEALGMPYLAKKLKFNFNWRPKQPKCSEYASGERSRERDRPSRRGHHSKRARS